MRAKNVVFCEGTQMECVCNWRLLKRLIVSRKSQQPITSIDKKKNLMNDRIVSLANIYPRNDDQEENVAKRRVEKMRWSLLLLIGKSFLLCHPVSCCSLCFALPSAKC